VKKYFVVLLLFLYALPALPHSINCETYYTVKSGDWLSKLADRAYHQKHEYQHIVDYNPGKISNPNMLKIGQRLYVPCLKGSDSPQVSVPALPQVVKPSTGESAAHPDSVKILTGSDYAPYVDDNLPNGGNSTELLTRALTANAADYNVELADFRIDVIKDWSMHLRPLLSEGAYVLAYPWFQPDCSEQDKLGPSSVWRCRNLLFSETLHDVVVKFYASSSNSSLPSSSEQLKESRICRPDGYFTHDLESMGLNADTYTRAAPPRPQDCFLLLLDGRVDTVTLNARTAERIITELNIRDDVVELLDLATVQSLHAVAMKTNPQATRLVQRLNAGLRKIKRYGMYEKIMSQYQ